MVHPNISPESTILIQSENTIQDDILNWYDANYRTLLWRTPPSPCKENHSNLTDPYKIWLSEIMLQQTTVIAVKPYFKKFIEKWPTIFNLAAARYEEVLSAWAGLGYYTRTRNLKKCADIIVQQYGGKFPDEIETLRKLPGIGDYTAAAIVAIAFNRFAVVVDANIKRVISRYFAITEPMPSAKSIIHTRTREITSISRPGDFAQAMMDLGSLICTPKQPSCISCPIQKNCLAFSKGITQSLPTKIKKEQKPLRVGAAFLAITPENKILLRKRTKGRLLNGMDELPGSDWTSKKDGGTDAKEAPFFAHWIFCDTVIHTFTHFNLKLFIWKADVPKTIAIPESRWCHIQDLKDAALPTVMKKAIAAARSLKKK
ncbi:A/G-specific adenine glycosylase [Candidatus Liberibacter sp.]|uniref:A/G-specific adenine glycosylase n=1 Tax=Candidatus Liberibacter sp. TaxID=34022 RepID=UPI0015F591FE|nr:A/G-specific adenine glycosylase [Candidatus Liberibacter sp.]MBA5724141.1 A/G-specific adenine glycosylase [Candidatus Liberibacter sp.]